MPGFVSFPQGANGTATLNAASIGGNSAVEFYVSTTATGPQTLFTVVHTFGREDIPLGYFSISMNGNAVDVGYAYVDLDNLYTSSATWSPSSYGIVLNDGGWHLISVVMGAGQVQIYVDACTALDSNNDPIPQPFVYSNSVEGNMMLGSARVAIQGMGVDGTFAGSLCEVRVWGTATNFVPTLLAPPLLNAPNLANYWPFWANYAGGQNQDVVNAGTSATLVGCAIEVAYYDASGPAPLIYHPWLEALLNTPYQAFPALDDASETGPVADICAYLVGQNILDGGATLSNLRGQYLNDMQVKGYALANAIMGAKPSQNTPAYVSMFELVQHQLYIEAAAACKVWEYQQDASNFGTNFNTTVGNALSLVGSGLTIQDIAANTQSPVSQLEKIATDMKNAIQIALKLLALFAAEAAAGRKGGPKRKSLHAQTTISEATALNFFYASSCYSVAWNGASTGAASMTVSTALSGAFSDLSAQIANFYNTALVGNVSSDVTAIVQDWGKLQIVANYPEQFFYPFAAPSTAAMNMIQLAHQLWFAQSILTDPAVMCMWYFPDNDPPQDVEYLYTGAASLLPYFYSVVTAEPSGAYSVTAICNFANPQNGGPAFTAALTSGSQSFLQNPPAWAPNAVQPYGCGLSSAEVLAWPFVMHTYYPGPSPGARRA